MRAPVIHRVEPAEPEQLGQPVRIRLIPLAARVLQPAAITHDDLLHDRRHQVMQPLRLSPFSKAT